MQLVNITHLSYRTNRTLIYYSAPDTQTCLLLNLEDRQSQEKMEFYVLLSVSSATTKLLSPEIQSQLALSTKSNVHNDREEGEKSCLALM